MNTLSLTHNRNTSLDLLRILCMIMVTILHFFNHGGLIEQSLQPLSINFFVGNTFFALCFVSVNCFVMISGYFLCQSSFKLSRVVSVWCKAFFYSITVYIIVTLLSGENFSVAKLIKSGLVVTLRQYWFFTAYILMLLLFPFMNKLIHAMNQKEHGLLCILLLFLFCILSNVIYICDFSGVNGGSSFIFFCVLYFVAAYFRLYIPERVSKQKLILLGYFVFTLIIVGERALAYLVTPLIWGEVKLSSLFFSYNSIACVGATLCLFQFFRGLKIRESFKYPISFFSPLVFAVYLIHDHPAMRPYLWGILHPASYADSPLLIAYMLICVLGIFIACCMIEYLRVMLSEILGIHNIVIKISDSLQAHITKQIDKSLD